MGLSIPNYKENYLKLCLLNTIGGTELVECLCEWVSQEADFQTIAAETVDGLCDRDTKSSRTFFGTYCDEPDSSTNVSDSKIQCICGEYHAVWECEVFLDMVTQWSLRDGKQHILTSFVSVV